MRYTVWFGCLLAVLAFGGPAWAQGNIYLGNVHVMPSLEYEIEHNDNIFLDHRDEESDVLHTVTPGLQLEYQRGEGRYASLSYETDIVRYSDFGSNDYEEHRLQGELEYASPSGWYARFEDRFVDTEDPYSTINNFQLGVPRIKRWTNQGTLRLGYELPSRFSVHASYQSFIAQYDAFRDQWRDRMDHVYEGRIMYRFWPKTSTFLMYRLSDINYPNQDDADDNSLGIDSRTSQENLYHQVFAGLYFSPAAKLKGELKVGVGRKDYDNARNWQGVAYNDSWEPSIEVELNYLMSEKTEFDFTLLRSTYESVDVETSSYTRNAAYITWYQQLIGNFSLQAEIGYALEDYETRSGLSDRDDDIYELGGKITYAIRDWLKTSLGYRYVERDTSDDLYRNEEYENNLFMWSIKAEL